MPIPKIRFHLVRKSEQRHDRSTTAHERRFRKICIEDLTLEDRICLRMTFPHHDGHTRLDDAGLFKSYFRESIT